MNKLVIADKRKFVIFLSSFLFLFFILLGLVTAVFFFNYQIHARPGISNPDIFIIEKGQGLEEIALNLEKEGRIKNDLWFVFYILLQGKAGNVIAGEYDLSNLSLLEIADKITGGDSLSDEVEVTIPEGFTLKKIDARLAGRGLIKEGELLADSRKLEGYLFPDTYRFDKDTDKEEIISKMRENFDRKMSQELKDEIKRQGKTVEEIVIMASLLEKEVPSYEDRQVVSGIFWQRLEDSYPLQSCATIAYVLDVDKWRYSTEDTKVDSPYNTYQQTGLPPTPINNPGLDSIKAAIYPQATDYYFFLSTPDGETIFSKTLEEHNRNKAKYLD